MIVTVEQFQKYSNVFTDNIELQESYLKSSQIIVADYLGYNPEEYLFNSKTCQLEKITEIPEIIKITIMRIASLLQSESDSNIGVTSKYFGDSGSRTFINYTNFDKYLLQVSNYRLIRI
ncbi:MAG: hypothetical protein FWD14_01910 [Treponema sp.]|nr:hypothetical protein [Treponema sp.]